MFKLVEDRSDSFFLLDDNAHDYNKFNLREHEEDIFFLQKQKIADVIAVNHYFICNKKMLDKDKFFILDSGHAYTVDKKQCQFSKCHLIDKHNLLLGAFSGARSSLQMNCDGADYLLRFKNTILDAQLAWATIFLRSVYGYLKNRRSNRDVLTNKEIVQIHISDVISHITSAEQFRKFSADSSREDVSVCQLSASQEIKLANQILAKLYGGRAFLAGNVVEMMMVFEYFKDIYFN